MRERTVPSRAPVTCAISSYESPCRNRSVNVRAVEPPQSRKRVVGCLAERSLVEAGKVSPAAEGLHRQVARYAEKPRPERNGALQPPDAPYDLDPDRLGDVVCGVRVCDAAQVVLDRCVVPPEELRHRLVAPEEIPDYQELVAKIFVCAAVYHSTI